MSDHPAMAPQPGQHVATEASGTDVAPIAGGEWITAATRDARTRRGFLGALVSGAISAALVGVLWLLARGRPSSGRDPAFTPPTRR